MAISFSEFSVNSSEEQARSLAAVLGEVGGESDYTRVTIAMETHAHNTPSC